jgi:hypothetical protein
MLRDYIKMRNSQKIDNNWLWKYYKQEGGKLNNPQEFLQHFYTETTPVMVNGMYFGEETKNRDLSEFFNDMDRKFKLNTLWDKEGKFIKVVE